MFKLVRRVLLFSLVASLPLSALAAAESGMQVVRQKLAVLLPGRAPDSIKQTPVPGLYQVRYGMQVFYLTRNGHYLLRGDLVDLKTKTDLTQQARMEARSHALHSLPSNSLLTYRPKGSVKHVIYVFSDINCPYCQQLHSDLPVLAAHGIEVRYLFFPRDGLGSPTAREAESVWCAKNRDQAYNRAMQGQPVHPATCANPVARDFNLGLKMGVQGTPTIVLSDGQILPGYLPPQQLLQAIRQATGVSS